MLAAALAASAFITSAIAQNVAKGQSKPATKSTRKSKDPWIGGSYPSGAKLQIIADLDKRVAKFKRVEMPFQRAKLSAREVKLVEKLVEASRYVDAIYWRQNDADGLTLYEQLRKSAAPRDQKIVRYLLINGGRFELLNDYKPFVGTSPFEPGRGWYPTGLTREQIEKYVAEHPEAKEEIYSPHTVVRQNGAELSGIPYRVVYRLYLDKAAKALNEAAALSDDAAFAEFLRARAKALLTDDYFASDLLWVDLKNPKVDVIFGPYETYLDGVLGVKASFGAAVLVRNEEESRKLEVYEKFVPEIQDALPIAKEDKPDKHGLRAPMEVMDAPFRAGDLLHGYQPVADNLPNDPRVNEEKGTKRIFFKNFMDARVKHVILPVAQKLMTREQAAKVSGSGYLAVVVMHEISHGLGPNFARTAAGKRPIDEAIGPIAAALEEAKADITGLYGIELMAERGGFPARRMGEVYASFLAGVFRSIRFGVAEPHGRAEMAEFNFLMERGAIRKEQGRPVWSVDESKMPAAIAALTKELLEIEATGDRTRAEQWFARYDKMPAELEQRLRLVTEVPVDVYPAYSFASGVQ
jgi:hypothetical protein